MGDLQDIILSIEQLEVLSIALLDFSEVADLVAWLEQQEASLGNWQWVSG